jgi:flagellar hook-length control protein FliK
MQTLSNMLPASIPMPKAGQAAGSPVAGDHPFAATLAGVETHPATGSVPVAEAPSPGPLTAAPTSGMKTAATLLVLGEPLDPHAGLVPTPEGATKPAGPAPSQTPPGHPQATAPDAATRASQPAAPASAARVPAALTSAVSTPARAVAPASITLAPAPAAASVTVVAGPVVAPSDPVPAGTVPAQPAALSKQAEAPVPKKTPTDAKPSPHGHRTEAAAHPAAVAADGAAPGPLPPVQPASDAAPVIPAGAAPPQPGGAAPAAPPMDIAAGTSPPTGPTILLQGVTETAAAAAVQPMQIAAPGNPASPAPAKSAATLLALPVGISASAPTAIVQAAAPSRADAPAVAGSLAGQMAPVLVQVAHAATGRQITLQLNPDELGQVTIHIERAADGTATIQVVAERPETLKLLQADQPQLHQALDDAGLPPDGRSLNLSLATPDTGGNSGGSGSLPGGHAGGHARQDQQAPPSAALPRGFGPAEPGVPPGWQRAGIDITA